MEDKKKLTWKERFEKVKEYCSEHSDTILCVLGGAASIIGGCIKLYAYKNEYDDNLFITDQDGNIHKLPAKQMKSANELMRGKKKE